MTSHISMQHSVGFKHKIVIRMTGKKHCKICVTSFTGEPTLMLQQIQRCKVFVCTLVQIILFINDDAFYVYETVFLLN